VYGGQQTMPKACLVVFSFQKFEFLNFVIVFRLLPKSKKVKNKHDETTENDSKSYPKSSNRFFKFTISNYNYSLIFSYYIN